MADYTTTLETIKWVLSMNTLTNFPPLHPDLSLPGGLIHQHTRVWMKRGRTSMKWPRESLLPAEGDRWNTLCLQRCAIGLIFTLVRVSTHHTQNRTKPTDCTIFWTPKLIFFWGMTLWALSLCSHGKTEKAWSWRRTMSWMHMTCEYRVRFIEWWLFMADAHCVAPNRLGHDYCERTVENLGVPVTTRCSVCNEIAFPDDMTIISDMDRSIVHKACHGGGCEA